MTQQAEIKTTMGLGEWSMLLMLALVWGASFFTVGIAIKELPPLTIVALRVVLAAIGLWLFIAITGRRMPGGRAVWLAFAGMGLLNNAIPFTLIVWGQQHIASGLASILNATTPFFVLIVANAFTRDERMSTNKLIGVLAGFFGVVCMLGVDLLAGALQSIWAQAAILLAAVSYAFAGVFGRRFARMGLDPVATATGQVTCSGLILAPLALMVDQPWSLSMPSMATMASVLTLALASTSIAYILYFRILKAAGATNLLLVTFLIPPIAIALGIAVLGEVLEVQHVIGVALIFVGLALIDGRVLTKLKAR